MERDRDRDRARDRDRELQTKQHKPPVRRPDKKLRERHEWESADARQ